MHALRRIAAIFGAFAVSMAITACWNYFCLRPHTPAWLTGIYTTCVVIGSLIGGMVGALIGYSIHACVYKKLGPQYCSIISMLLAPVPSALFGAFLALIIAGQMWPPEMVYGHDPDRLVGYGFVAGAITALVFATGLASGQPRAASQTANHIHGGPQMPFTQRAMRAFLSISLSITGGFFLILLGLSITRGDLEHAVVASQCLAVVLIAITAFACLTQAKLAYPISMLTIVFAYVVTAISLAIGSWAWGAVINAGSANPALAIGNTIIRDGDYGPVYVNTDLWLIEMTILTAATILTTRAIVTLFRRNNARQATPK